MRKRCPSTPLPSSRGRCPQKINAIITSQSGLDLFRQVAKPVLFKTFWSCLKPFYRLGFEMVVQGPFWGISKRIFEVISKAHSRTMKGFLKDMCKTLKGFLRQAFEGILNDFIRFFADIWKACEGLLKGLWDGFESFLNACCKQFQGILMAQESSQSLPPDLWKGVEGLNSLAKAVLKAIQTQFEVVSRVFWVLLTGCRMPVKTFVRSLWNTVWRPFLGFLKAASFINYFSMAF